ncbi:hypothetical protein GU926_06880 [Nibribacter ruber]|uniref:Uncharacterized protein n=1 Tax=Nibribacter ruber TaxID=2698458 RepID=A0A6P1NY76_9BACT|nr:hypothetical protein [Nibribacter ruber]QHL87169.1 hypothetical protein GU926_06880 [Nibribacter ruber]
MLLTLGQKKIPVKEESILEALYQLFSECREAYDAHHYPVSDIELYVEEAVKLLENWLLLKPQDAKLTRRTWALLKLAQQQGKALPQEEAKEHLAREASVSLELFLQLKSG